jgi:hypothetical protein
MHPAAAALTIKECLVAIWNGLMWNHQQFESSDVIRIE